LTDSLGFHHAEQGQILSGKALHDFARSESFAFVYSLRLFSRWASALRLVYEQAFIETYTAMVERSRALKSAQ
jgi:hypothetical protein